MAEYARWGLLRLSTNCLLRQSLWCSTVCLSVLAATLRLRHTQLLSMYSMSSTRFSTALQTALNPWLVSATDKAIIKNPSHTALRPHHRRLRCRRVVYCNILRGERNRKHLQHARRKRAARRRHARNATVLHLFAVLRLQSAVFILLFSVQQGRLCPAHNRFERSCDNHSDCIPLLISVEDDGALARHSGSGTRYACRNALHLFITRAKKEELIPCPEYRKEAWKRTFYRHSLYQKARQIAVLFPCNIVVTLA